MEYLVLALVLLVLLGFVTVRSRRGRVPAGSQPEALRGEGPAGEVGREAGSGEGAPVAAAVVEPTYAGSLSRSRGPFSQLFARIKGQGEVETVTRQVEETLILADVGPALAEAIAGDLRGSLAGGSLDAESVRSALAAELKGRFLDADRTLHLGDQKPGVVLFVGVNGTGKTTTIGKLAAHLAGEGTKVTVAAGDTFRAAATEQVSIWAEQAGVDLVSGQAGADPASVIFDAIDHAGAIGSDVVLCDTAGRLQNKGNLMEELRKIRRVAEKGAGSVSEVLLVIDATTGQNGLAQARAFGEAVAVTGVVLTKLDGSSKGGVALAIESTLGLPVKLVGLGEGLGALKPFDVEAFVDGLLGGMD